IRGAKAAYALWYTEGVWEKRQANDYDLNADAALLGRDKVDTKDADKVATVLVLALPPQPDLKAAVTAARANLEARIKQDQRNVVIEIAKDKDGKPEDRPAKIGKAA